MKPINFNNCLEYGKNSTELLTAPNNLPLLSLRTF